MVKMSAVPSSIMSIIVMRSCPLVV